MQKKIIVSSILTIALCLSVIVGATYALFTDSVTNSIVVSSGDVEIDATVTNLTRYSVLATDSATPEVRDEKNRGYNFVNSGATFTNGGTAEFDSATATLTITNMTPGDRVTFTLSGQNTSTVAALYRYKLTCNSGTDLMSGLKINVGNGQPAYTGITGYTSGWTTLNPVNAATGAAGTFSVNISIELPVTAGIEYENLSTSITLNVEAVQGNANVLADTETFS